MSAIAVESKRPPSGNPDPGKLAAIADVAARSSLGLKPVWHEPLAKHTSVRVGGAADLLIRVRSREALRIVVTEAYRHAISFRVIGDGTNLIAADAGVRGLVVRNHGGERGQRADGVSIWADAGCSLISTARWAAGLGLSGLEGAATIPGTVGGAVVNNAGAYGWTAAESVSRIKALDRQGERWIYPDEMAYAYRTSTIKERPGYAVVLGAELRLTRGDPDRILGTIQERLQTRQRTQPTAPSSGSVFRNPPGESAWKLIDEAGMRGKTMGGAHVSRQHANFIINDGPAKADDVLGLIRAIEQAVKRRSHVTLQREVELFGEWKV